MMIATEPANRSTVRWYAAGLAALSLIALTMTAWILLYVHREQEIVAGIVKHLPKSDMAAASELTGDLRLQNWLSILLVVNLVVTAIAFTILVRGYLNSERSLRDARVLSADILASMDAGVITADRDGILTSINPRGCELIGILDNGIGLPLTKFDPAHQRLAVIHDEVRTFHHSIRDRDYVVAREGYDQTLRTSCTLLRNQNGNEIGTVLQVRDVTQKALIEDQLRRMERFMGLGSLAAGLQHEIKNPLSALSLHIDLLCERLIAADLAAPQDSDVNEMLDVLKTEVNRITGVLDGFRNYASATELGQTDIDVPALIEKLARLLRPQTSAQNISIELALPDKPLGAVRGDSIRLEQVLLNLALNGVAAMPSGGVLKFRVTRRDDSLCIAVIDTGHGIPPEIRSQIFDPYFTTRGDGTGMGLALCDKFIRQHNGTIDVRSNVGLTEFTILLPMETVA